MFLSSCYLPSSFDAEMELSRQGLYKITFDGYIVDLNIYTGLRDKKYKEGSEEVKKKVKAVIDDFKRDTATKSVSYFRQGAFKVRWVKGGDIIKVRQSVFFRRNENMFSVTYNKKKAIITLRGRYIKKQDAARLEQMGIGLQGVIRINTDAKVIQHNAQKEWIHNAQKEWIEKGIRHYGWRLKSLRDRPPILIVSLGLL